MSFTQNLLLIYFWEREEFEKSLFKAPPLRLIRARFVENKCYIQAAFLFGALTTEQAK